MTDPRAALKLREAQDHLRSGNLAEAEAICDRVLRRDKRNLPALEMLARIASATFAFDRAASWLKKCIAVRPRDPAMHYKLASVRVSQGRYEEAIAGFNKVLALRPDSRFALAWKADILERQGEYEKARVLLKPFIEAGTEDPAMMVVYATLEQRAGRHREAIALAERHVDRPEAEGRPRCRLWCVIGMSHEQLGSPDAAFAAYREANGAVAGAFYADRFVARIDGIIEAFSAERLAALPRATHGSQLPVFVVGIPRTGSTLVEKILDAHPRAHGAGETAAFEMVVRSIPDYPSSVGELTQHAVERLAGDYLDALVRRGADRVVDKFLSNYLNLGMVEMLFPEARIIDCRRDPLDTCLSCYASPLNPDHNAYANDLGHLGLVYREYERLMRHWRAVLNLRMMEVRYEELVADQERVTRTIIEFCGLEWDEACLRYYDSKRPAATLSYEQVRRPIYRGSVGRAGKFEAYLSPLREALGQTP